MVLLPEPLGDDFDHDVGLHPVIRPDWLLLLPPLLLHLNINPRAAAVRTGSPEKPEHAAGAEGAFSTSMISSRADFFFLSALLESELDGASFLLAEAAALRALAPRAGLQGGEDGVR